MYVGNHRGLATSPSEIELFRLHLIIIEINNHACIFLPSCGMGPDIPQFRMLGITFSVVCAKGRMVIKIFPRNRENIIFARKSIKLTKFRYFSRFFYRKLLKNSEN